jgi:hypothetical protein
MKTTCQGICLQFWMILEQITDTFVWAVILSRVYGSDSFTITRNQNNFNSQSIFSTIVIWFGLSLSSDLNHDWPELWLLIYDCVHSESYVTTESQSASLEIKHPFRPDDQMFITVRQLCVSWCGALSLTRGWVCLLALASAVILGSESRATRNRYFLFRRLLRLAGLRWKYSTSDFTLESDFILIWTASYIAYRYPRKRVLTTWIHGNICW